MTNREMAKGLRPENAPKANARTLQEMPAAEDSKTPTTLDEPIDSPQPNESGRRAAPNSHRGGLTTERE